MNVNDGFSSTAALIGDVEKNRVADAAALRSSLSYMHDKLSSMEHLIQPFANLQSRDGSVQIQSAITAHSMEQCNRILRDQISSSIGPVLEDQVASIKQEFRSWYRGQLNSELSPLLQRAFGELTVEVVRHPADASPEEPLNTSTPSTMDYTKKTSSETRLETICGPDNVYPGSGSGQQIRVEHKGKFRCVRHISKNLLVGRLSILVRELISCGGVHLQGRVNCVTTVTFQPAKFLLSRGLSIIYEQQMDQRGYPIIRPEIQTFAIVAEDCAAFRCVLRNDAEGLQSLLSRGEAAPSDVGRDIGINLLWVFEPFSSYTQQFANLKEYTVFCGRYQLCEMLLACGGNASDVNQ
jgi:hypothetical protein